MPYVLFVLLSFIWGTNFLLMKKATLWYAPMSVAAWRVVGGAMFLAAVVLVRKQAWRVPRRDLAPLLAVAACGYVWPFYIQPELIDRCGSGFIAMMVAFVPLATILVSVPMLRILPSPRQVVGVAGGLVCLGLILLDGLSVRGISGRDFALAVSVPLMYATTNTYIKRRFVGLAPLPLTLTAMVMSAGILVPLAVTLDGNVAVAGATVSAPAAPATRPFVDGNDYPLALASCIALGVLGTGFGVYIFTKMLQEQGPLFAGMVTYLIPTIALAWGWLDGERVTPLQLVALAGVLAMVAVVQFGAAGASPIHPRGLDSGEIRVGDGP